jgi:hypothetical protein
VNESTKSFWWGVSAGAVGILLSWLVFSPIPREQHGVGLVLSEEVSNRVERAFEDGLFYGALEYRLMSKPVASNITCNLFVAEEVEVQQAIRGGRELARHWCVRW